MALASAICGGFLVGACGGGGNGSSGDEPISHSEEWFQEQTISARVALPLPGSTEWLKAEQIRDQLVDYDPGSMARCAADDDSDYNGVVDELGGVRWGYSVRVIPDTSKPIFQSGYHFIGGDGDLGIAEEGGGSVEIAEADIVGVSETNALFLSKEHGLMLVDLSANDASFRCATKLPGLVDQFYLHNDRLVVMTQALTGWQSYLLHFDVSDNEIAFVEAVDLGKSHVLDSRRFNDRLVMYTDLLLDGQEPPQNYGQQGDPDYGEFSTFVPPHRMVRVFNWGETLQEEMTETAIDGALSEDEMVRLPADENTPLGTQVDRWTRYGHSMWASDRYFVVSEEVTDTTFAGMKTDTYSVCVEGHTVTEEYTSCSTEYETRPNPSYVPPDNSGGDRACHGETLADCIQTVSRVAAETIHVPIGRTCVPAERSSYVCDARETRTSSYPTFANEVHTRLYVYEYTEDGFIRFGDDVAEIDAAALLDESLDSTVELLPMTDEIAKLTLPGHVQTVQFQNGYLYVIAQGLLQTFALAENSLIRTSSLVVSGANIEGTRFTSDKLYLSDEQWGGSQSVLRVIDLSNGAFPKQSSQDRTLPGGHTVIIPTASGILTTGHVNSFEGKPVNILKVGLFEDPSTVELSYLFLATDLDQPKMSDLEAMYFDSANERLFLPYTGHDYDMSWLAMHRVGVSRVQNKLLVSEGAIDMAQEPERIRPRPGTSDMLAFSSSSIQTLSLGESEWQATPVLELFTPTGVYRYTDQDDYVEVLNLGNRCRLHFSRGANINDRSNEKLSEPFLCQNGFANGYGMHLLFTPEIAVAFDAEGNTEQIREAEATELWERSRDRTYCLFSSEVAQGDPTVDMDESQDMSALFCQSRDDYFRAADEANGY